MSYDAARSERVDVALLRRYREHGDLQAREQLVERCTGLVKSIARKYVRRGQDFDELVQAGMVGLTKAIERYRPDQGARFVSFAVPNIQGEIRRHFRDATWAVHVPRSMQELDQKIHRLTAEILTDTGREPTVDDLAAELETTPQQITEAIRAGGAYRALSTDAPIGGPGEDEGERFLGGARGELDRGYDDVERRSLIDTAMQGLDDRARKVVRLRYQEGLLQREIAAQIGVSQMQISRILASSLKIMSTAVTVDVVLDDQLDAALIEAA